MLVRSILAVLGATALAAAASPKAPAVTPFLTTSGSGVPTTLVPVPLPATISSTAALALSKNLTYSTAAPALPQNSASSALNKTVTSTIAATRTVTLRPVKTTSYQACGGFRATPTPCPASFECIKNPFDGGCGPACDGPGICVVPIKCGGFPGTKCPDGKICVDDPRDDCIPGKGGADCIGLCL
ncbi:hypothetical protein CGRA01v4_14262 [Colletotrichum graminicola]|uniref:Uncharacterized protein n=1 Tax=Colletotrichum graminicola (strain M1.001 / M2 / FGSC 10212) TaxID=645133 RepID=E3Q591_COLGM|nr:uncharacterized protein GLRG_01002 [Colletotrichum graminicola M1.001]EFQ25858.1 hypothetical protein GLRG_01002 [Colletotrichum graminicola M1.001]WDK22971.1 hypothetical protein CGRA01v4_14262 [Colletotrichum graminicola]